MKKLIAILIALTFLSNVNAIEFEMTKNDEFNLSLYNSLLSNPVRNKFDYITYDVTIKSLFDLNFNLVKYNTNDGFKAIDYKTYYTFSPTIKIGKSWNIKNVCDIDLWTKSVFDSDAFKVNEFNHRNISAEVGYTITF